MVHERWEQSTPEGGMFWLMSKYHPAAGTARRGSFHQGHGRSNCACPPLTTLFFDVLCKAVIRSSGRTLTTGLPVASHRTEARGFCSRLGVTELQAGTPDTHQEKLATRLVIACLPLNFLPAVNTHPD